MPRTAQFMTAFVAGLVLAAGSISASAADFSSQIKAIKSVGREGAGNAAAALAVKQLQSASVSDLTHLLGAFEGASPLAANYLRGAIEAIIDQQISQKIALPTSDLEAFVRDVKQDPRARRLAYEILLRVDSAAEARIIPDMLTDPSPDFRRDAVARLINAAKTAEGAAAIKTYRQALGGATDSDQVKEIAEAIRKAGEKVDLVSHFGFLTSWRIIGPFDNTKFVGFDAKYPPEETIDLDAKLEGQLGEVTWGEITTDDEYGIVDVAKSVSPYKGAVMYLTTTFDVATARNVDLRFGTPNAWKLWVNGELLFGRDEYHRGMAIDQYRVPAKLKAGKNVVLLKLCQNEQEDSWAQRYQIQIRVCDASGIAIHPVAALPARSTRLTAIKAD
jgi:hypothetical protein